MATLHIELMDGFANDTVVVKVNGAEIARQEGVSTRHQIGHAGSIEADVPDGPMRLNVELTSRGISASRTVTSTPPPKLAVSVTGQGTLDISDDPTRFYMA
jgi:hypothetical protein